MLKNRKNIQKILIESFIALDIDTNILISFIKTLKSSKNNENTRRAFHEFKKIIKHKYINHAKIHHPDKGGSEIEFKKFGQILQTINELEKELTKPRSKLIYINNNLIKILIM
jgi:hypothetical protein